MFASTTESDDYSHLYDHHEETSFKDTTKSSIAYMVLSYFTLILATVCFLICFICIVGLFRNKKYKTNVKYELILVYWCFKIVQSLLTFETILINEFLMPSFVVCVFRYILHSFFDTNSACLLATIWLIIATERKMIDFCLFLVEKKNKRYCFMLTFCVINMALALYDAYMESSLTHDYCQSKNLSLFYSFSFRTIALSFWMIGLSVILWTFFGGSRDPIKLEMIVCDFNFLLFLKITCILEAFNVLIAHIWVVLTMLGTNSDLIIKLLSNLSFFVSLLVFLIIEKSFNDFIGLSNQNTSAACNNSSSSNSNNNKDNTDNSSNVNDNTYLVYNNNTDLQINI